MGQSPDRRDNRILVVDDEVLVRMHVADILQDEGFVVLEAANADEAIRLLDTNDDITIMVTDVEMPGSMDGARLAHHVRERWPPVRILVISGKAGFEPGQLPRAARFLRKPFAAHEMRSAIADLAA